MDIEKNSYHFILISMVRMLQGATNNYNELANGIFNGLDMFNESLIDGKNDLSSTKQKGILFIRKINPDVKEEEIKPITALLCQIFTNANKHFMGSRVIQHKLSSESRCFYLPYDKEKNEKDALKCRDYLHKLLFVLVNDSLFPDNIKNLDMKIAEIVITNPEFNYQIADLKDNIDKHKSLLHASTIDDILFEQLFFPNGLTLDYLNGNLLFLLKRANLVQNTKLKLNIIKDFWTFNSTWCSKYKRLDGNDDNAALNPDQRVYDLLVTGEEPNRHKYIELKRALNRIMFYVATLGDNQLIKLTDNPFFQKVEEVINEPQMIKKLITTKTNNE